MSERRPRSIEINAYTAFIYTTKIIYYYYIPSVYIGARESPTCRCDRPDYYYYFHTTNKGHDEFRSKTACGCVMRGAAGSTCLKNVDPGLGVVLYIGNNRGRGVAVVPFGNRQNRVSTQ